MKEVIIDLPITGISGGSYKPGETLPQNFLPEGVGGQYWGIASPSGLRTDLIKLAASSRQNVLDHEALPTIKTPITKGDKIVFMSNNAQYKVEEVGLFQIERKPQNSLIAGQVGYVIAGIKNIRDVKIGDTITMPDKRCTKALGGFGLLFACSQSVKRCSIYPK